MKTIYGINVLEEADIRRKCSSFYAEEPKSTVSDKYGFINTRDVALGLWQHGWMPKWAEETRSNLATNRGYNRHMIRWAHPDCLLPNGDRVEIVGVNSHNRSSIFRLMAGVFRTVCSNGCITMSSDFGCFEIRHLGDIMGQVETALNEIGPLTKRIPCKIVEMQETPLRQEEQLILASAAHGYVYTEPETAPIKPHQLLVPRRREDKGNTLWSTYNVIQENIMQGGIRGVLTGHRTRTRRIRNIDKNVRINQALWELTEKMCELKHAS